MGRFLGSIRLPGLGFLCGVFFLCKKSFYIFLCANQLLHLIPYLAVVRVSCFLFCQQLGIFRIQLLDLGEFFQVGFMYLIQWSHCWLPSLVLLGSFSPCRRYYRTLVFCFRQLHQSQNTICEDRPLFYWHSVAVHLAGETHRCDTKRNAFGLPSLHRQWASLQNRIHVPRLLCIFQAAPDRLSAYPDYYKPMQSVYLRFSFFTTPSYWHIQLFRLIHIAGRTPVQKSKSEPDSIAISSI